MADPKVLVYTPMGDADAEYSELENAGCEVTFGNAEWRRAFGADESNVFPLADRRDAIIGAVMRGFTFSHDFMSRLPSTRIIAKLTIGYDDVDIDAAADLGILVTSFADRGKLGWRRRRHDDDDAHHAETHPRKRPSCPRRRMA